MEDYGDKIPSGDRLYSHPVFVQKWKQINSYLVKVHACFGGTTGISLSCTIMMNHNFSLSSIVQFCITLSIVCMINHPETVIRFTNTFSVGFEALTCILTLQDDGPDLIGFAFYFTSRSVIAALLYESYQTYIVTSVIGIFLMHHFETAKTTAALEEIIHTNNQFLQIFSCVMVFIWLVIPILGLQVRTQSCKDAVTSHIVCELSRQEYAHLHSVFSYTAHEYRNQFLLARLSLYQLSYAVKHTPLSPIEQFEQDLQVIEFSHDNIGRLFNDVLTIHKMDQETSEQVDHSSTFKSFNLWKGLICPLIIYGRNIVKLDPKTGKMRLHAEDTRFMIEGDSSKAKHCFILGDELKLVQAITNLISNAFKFTTKGFVKLKYTVKEHESDQFDIAISVCDSGRGIPQQKLNEIFVAFHQCRPGDSIERGGTGLGLTIAKRIIENVHKGRIRVESEVNKGSEFSVSMRLKRGVINNEIEPETITNTLKLWAQLKTVLIVDDCKLNRMVLSRVIKNVFKGMKLAPPTILTAENGLVAIDCVKTSASEFSKVDLIIIDRHMPVLDGIQAVKMIRRLKPEIFSGLIIGFSGDVTFNHWGVLENEALDGRIVKGCSVNEIEEEIERTLTEKFMQDQLLSVDAEDYARASQPQTEIVNTKGLNKNDLSNVLRKRIYQAS